MKYHNTEIKEIDLKLPRNYLGGSKRITWQFDFPKGAFKFYLTAVKIKKRGMKRAGKTKYFYSFSVYK